LLGLWGLLESVDAEFLAICVETPCDDNFLLLNIAMRFLHRRGAERTAVPALG